MIPRGPLLACGLVMAAGTALALHRSHRPAAVRHAAELPSLHLQPRPTPTEAAPPAAPTAAPAPALVLAAPRLDPQSDAFRVRTDEQIPGRLYAAAAACYHGGLDRDRKLKLAFHARVADGQVSATEVRVVASTLGDPALERCLVAEVAHASWRDDSMPDWDADQELLLRVRGFKQYQQAPDAEP